MLFDDVRVAPSRLSLQAERGTEAYAKKRASATARRDREQAAYVVSFEEQVLEFLRFVPRFGEMARALARQVTSHATPVGSGTVARTERIPVERRAESAVVAYAPHEDREPSTRAATTAYSIVGRTP